MQLCKLVLCVDGHGEGATHACRRVRVSGTLAWRTIAPVSLGSSLKEESQLTYTPEYVFKSPSLFFLGAHSNAEITQSIDNRIRAWYEMTKWLKLTRTAVPSILRCLICTPILIIFICLSFFFSFPLISWRLRGQGGGEGSTKRNNATRCIGRDLVLEDWEGHPIWSVTFSHVYIG